MESAQERFVLFVLNRLARLESTVEARIRQVEPRIDALQKGFLKQ